MILRGHFRGRCRLLALTATPLYRAEVVVIPTRESGVGDAASLASRLGGLAGLAGINLGANSGAGSDALAVLRSRNLVEQFVSSNDLVADLLPVRGLSSFGLRWIAFVRTVVSIVTDNDRGTTTIAIKWRDPSVAANWADEFVALANDIVRTRALEDSAAISTI